MIKEVKKTKGERTRESVAKVKNINIINVTSKSSR